MGGSQRLLFGTENIMRKYGMFAAVCAVMALGASTAWAQSSAKVGLTMSSGSAIGIHVPIGDRAAVRPTLAFSRSTSDYVGSQFIDGSITSTTLAPGISVLFHVKSWDATRLYVSPQYTYTRLTSSSLDGAHGSHGGAFMVGAQHGLGARFGVYAEGGIGWSHSKNTTSTQLTSSSITTNAWSTRATVGGILFF
jgi:hypothetical protein